jgi:hypothetical protein
VLVGVFTGVTVEAHVGVPVFVGLCVGVALAVSVALAVVVGVWLEVVRAVGVTCDAINSMTSAVTSAAVFRPSPFTSVPSPMGSPNRVSTTTVRGGSGCATPPSTSPGNAWALRAAIHRHAAMAASNRRTVDMCTLLCISSRRTDVRLDVLISDRDAFRMLQTAMEIAIGFVRH